MIRLARLAAAPDMAASALKSRVAAFVGTQTAALVGHVSRFAELLDAGMSYEAGGERVTNKLMFGEMVEGAASWPDRLPRTLFNPNPIAVNEKMTMLPSMQQAANATEEEKWIRWMHTFLFVDGGLSVIYSQTQNEPFRKAPAATHRALAASAMSVLIGIFSKHIGPRLQPLIHSIPALVNNLEEILKFA